MYYLVLWGGAGLSAGPQTFISLFSLLVAVGEDGEIWKLYGIKRKRLIRLMLITWDLEKKVFCCNHPASLASNHNLSDVMEASPIRKTILNLYHNRDLIVNLIQDE